MAVARRSTILCQRMISQSGSVVNTKTIVTWRMALCYQVCAGRCASYGVSSLVHNQRINAPLESSSGASVPALDIATLDMFVVDSGGTYTGKTGSKSLRRISLSICCNICRTMHAQVQQYCPNLTRVGHGRTHFTQVLPWLFLGMVRRGCRSA